MLRSVKTITELTVGTSRRKVVSLFNTFAGSVAEMPARMSKLFSSHPSLTVTLAFLLQNRPLYLNFHLRGSGQSAALDTSEQITPLLALVRANPLISVTARMVSLEGCKPAVEPLIERYHTGRSRNRRNVFRFYLSWMRIAVTIAFVRANASSVLKNSIISWLLN